MSDFSLEDLAHPVAIASPNFAVKVAAGALVFGCGIYRDYPGAVLGQNPQAFVKGLMDTLCDDRPPGLPPPPAPPFTGGQCPVGYGFTTSSPFVNQNLPSGLAPNISQSSPLWGAVTKFNKIPFRNASGHWLLSVTCAESQGSPNQINRDIFVGLASEPEPIIGNLQRFDGAVDNCGSLPASYPPSVIPDSRKTGSVTNVYNDGTDFVIPLIYTPVTLSAPLTINAGGVNFKFDFGGLTIGDGDDAITNVVNNIAGDVTKIEADTTIIRNDLTITRQEVDTVNNTVTRVEGDVTNLTNNVNNVTTIITNAPIPPEQITEEPPTEDPEKEDVSNLFAVRLKLTQIPINSKQQFGVGAPNVFYAGWFEFRRGAFCFPREPVAFEEGIFRAPIGADGYAYTLYVGYRGEATVIKLDTSTEVEA